jgi:hypothetical protein
MQKRILGALETPRQLHAHISPALFVLAALVLAGGALISATGASAGAAVSETTPFTVDGVNTCTGEPFTGTGTLHFLMSDGVSSSGAIQHHLETTLNGLQAVTPLGKKYVVQETFNDEFVFSGAAEETFAITAHFIRVGEDGTFILGDDFYEYLRTHITANANGMVTAFDVRTNDMPCQ